MKMSGALKKDTNPLFLQAGSPVSLFPRQVSAEEREMTVISGLKCFESYKLLNRDGSLLKMFLASLLGTRAWYSSRCVLIWRLLGTRYNRLLFRLVPSMHPTEGTGYGLLLTPSTINVEGGDERREKRTAYRASIGRQDVFGGLAEQIAYMLPTPASRDWKGGGTNGWDCLDSVIEMDARKGETGRKTGLKLHPTFVEWMMDYPEGWTELND
jgi:hypothetical protein